MDGYDCCVTNVVIGMFNQLTQWGEGWCSLGTGEGLSGVHRDGIG